MLSFFDILYTCIFIVNNFNRNIIIKLFCVVLAIKHKFDTIYSHYTNSMKWMSLVEEKLLSLPNKVWETYCFCSVSYYYYYSLSSLSLSPFFPWTMNLSTADLRNYWTEFHETLWSYRYMFLVGPKVFSSVVKGVKVIFWGVQRGWGLL